MGAPCTACVGLIDFGQSAVWFDAWLPLSSGCLVKRPLTLGGTQLVDASGRAGLHSGNLGGGSECGHLQSPEREAPPELVVSPCCLRELLWCPVPPTTAPASRSPGFFRAPPAGSHTSALRLDLEVPSSLLASLPVRDLPGTVFLRHAPPSQGRRSHSLPFPFSHFSFPARLYGDFCLLEV